MPASALPKDYQLGPDNRTWLMRLKKKVQIVFAAGPRVPKGFWKWREIPITLFTIKGKQFWRWENSDGSKSEPINYRNFMFNGYFDYSKSGIYLSRIQPWCRWHFALMWPLFLNVHVIYRAKNVVEYPKYQSDFGITKMFTFHIGYKRDSDKVYWPTMYVGGNFE